MAEVGKFLGLISPILALGIVALMLFGWGYSYQSSDPVKCTYESGEISALRYALEEGDTALFYWSVVMVLVCLIAAVGALIGRIILVWIAAVVLWILMMVGMMSIGLFIFPLAVALLASAVLLAVARYDRLST